MGLWGRKARRGESLIEEIGQALNYAPVAEMEELIGLAQSQANVKRAVVERIERISADGDDDMVTCWFILVAGELGREGLLPVIGGIGKSEGDAPDEAAIPVLTRHVIEVLPDLLREVHLAEEADRRLALYEPLEGAIVLGDEGVKERLKTFALERYEVEKSSPEGPELIYEPLFLLHYLGEGSVGAKLREARGLCGRGDLLDRNLNDLEASMAGEDFLSLTREIVKEDWKATVRNLEKAFDFRQR